MTLLGDLKASQDVAVAISTKDTLAKRPSPGVMGRFFHAEDVNALYRDNGATWELTSVAAGLGTFSARPAAAIAGREYKATDRVGVIFRDDSGAWDNLLASITPGALASRPAPAIAGRVYETTDVGTSYLDTGSAWLPIIHPTSGAVGSRPGATFVDGREYRPTDVANLLYRDNGASWDSILLNGGGSGVLASRPAAGRAGMQYRATDTNVLYFDTGSEWIALTIEPGTLRFSAAAAVPEGWLKCEGQAVSRTTFAALWKALGEGASPWGLGNGATTFNVPDYRERVPIAPGGTLALAAKGGEQTHTLTEAEIPAHNHGTSTGLQVLTYYSAGGGPLIAQAAGSGLQMGPAGINTFGGSAAHNNMQPYTVSNVLIKT